MAKSDNMLAILWMLHSRNRITANQIANELEISTRSVYRYIDALCASGVPVVADSGHKGGYSLPANFKLSPLFFDPIELRAMFQAAEFAFRAGYPNHEALRSALDKLKHNASFMQVQTIARDTAEFRVLSALRGGPVSHLLPTLDEAISGERTLRILYQKPNQEQPDWRTVDPYGLAFDSGVWYLAAHCHQRDQMRDFRVDRIVEIQPTPHTFQRPSEFSLSTYFSNRHFVDALTTGPFETVQIRGSTYAIDSISDHWFLRHCVARKSTTEVFLHINPQAMERMPMFLLGYGVAIEVVTPIELRRTMHTLAQSVVDHYSKNLP